MERKEKEDGDVNSVSLRKSSYLFSTQLVLSTWNEVVHDDEDHSSSGEGKRVRKERFSERDGRSAQQA